MREKQTNKKKEQKGRNGIFSFPAITENIIKYY